MTIHSSGGSSDVTSDDQGLSIAAPADSLRDEPITVRITGATPGARVTFGASMPDSAGADWQSRATFAADQNGVVDLTEHAPETGSYDGVEPMGWLWSMTPDDEADARFQPDVSAPYEVTYTAEADGETATATVEIRHAAPGVDRHDVSRPGLFGTWYEPAGDGPHPAVVLLHGSGGNVMEAEAALLASRGFAAFALRYLGVGDLPDHPVGVPLDYVQDAISWFRDRDVVASDSLGLYGVSMGGQLALLLASREDYVDAVVSDAGSVHVTGAERSAWSVDGESVPHLRPPDVPPEIFDRETDAGRVLRERCVQLLARASDANREAATIPVEDAEASILLLSGSDDKYWPATTFASIAVARLDALDYEHPYEHRAYHDAGHPVGTPYRPTSWRPAASGPVRGGKPAAQASAQADAWPRIVSLFEASLGEMSTTD